MMREEVTERGRKGERDRDSPFPLMEQASAMLFLLITLMTNLKQFKIHFRVSPSLSLFLFPPLSSPTLHLTLTHSSSPLSFLSSFFHQLYSSSLALC